MPCQAWFNHTEGTSLSSSSPPRPVKDYMAADMAGYAGETDDVVGYVDVAGSNDVADDVARTGVVADDVVLTWLG